VESVRRWIEASPYTATLGIALDALDAESVRLRLPFDEKLTNGDQVMHGGCAASLAATGAHALARATLGSEAGPFHTLSLQVNYLSAAKSQGVVANARLLRRGKELCFIEVDIEGDDGRAIAHATTAVRGRFGAEPAALAISPGDHGESDPGVMGPHIGRIPFIAGRNISVRHMVGGTSRLVMPWADTNADEDGGVHEGAILSLLDTAGAMASWAVTGAGPYKAGTPSMQAQVFAPPPREDLVAYGRNVQADNEIFFSDAEAVSAVDGRVYARATVFYRIVT